MRGNRTTYLLMGIIILLMNVLVLWEIWGAGNHELYEEGEFIENTTAFSFMFSGILLLFLSLGNSGLERILTLIFSATCLMFFLREVDVEDFSIPHGLQLVASGMGRNVVFSLVYLLLGWGVLANLRKRVDFKIGPLFRSEVAIVVMVGCGCILVGDFFQHLDSVMGEEILEMNGGLLILLAAILHVRTPIWKG
ncbi:MAG: hypothetical protein OSA48_01870 [Akkermansiaceae bacterium]|nr:hypothetical protein [Akkermansiaceae bacterium]